MPTPLPTAAIEIQALYADFAAMADAIEHRSRYLRDFAHAMSHEFKTPLAGIRGALDLLADHPAMDAANRSRFLANADADAQRLTLLVSRLLDLARADMASAEPDVAVALEPVLVRIADAHRASTFAVEVDVSTPLPPITVPATTLEAVLTALLDNSRQAGAHKVGIAAQTLPDRIELALTVDGPGIAPADRTRLFEPFFTTRRTEGGSGLGLAIARSLLNVAGATIALAPEERTRFILGLPWAER